MEADTLQVEEQEMVVLRGKIIARDVPYEEYLTGKYGRHVEWVFGIMYNGTS
ncbi:MAG: hypothetical protein U0694_14805 [Anaerolineae bacterium]